MKHTFELRVKDQMEKRSTFTQLKQLRKEGLKKKSGLNGNRTHDLCDAGVVLYKLSYQATTIWSYCEFVIYPYRIIYSWAGILLTQMNPYFDHFIDSNILAIQSDTNIR